MTDAHAHLKALTGNLSYWRQCSIVGLPPTSSLKVLPSLAQFLCGVEHNAARAAPRFSTVQPPGRLLGIYGLKGGS